MARPSVKAERTEEILIAFERCVARFGVEGTSLERIAEESGLRRSLLRYYIGNRDELVEALTDRFIDKTTEVMEELYTGLPDKNTAEAMVYALFAPYDRTDSAVLVAEALIAAADRYPTVQDKLSSWYERFLDRVCDLIQADYPDVARDRCWTVSVGIVSIYFNADSMDTLKLSGRYREASIQSALLLLRSLA